MCITHQHHTCRVYASFETTRMVTVTIHVQIAQRLLWMPVRRTTAQVVDFSSNTVRDASNWSSIVPSVSACLVPIPSSNMTDLAYDRSGLSCDKYAALITTLRYCFVCNAFNCGDVINTSSSLFLTDGVVTPFALSRSSHPSHFPGSAI